MTKNPDWNYIEVKHPTHCRQKIMRFKGEKVIQ